MLNDLCVYVCELKEVAHMQVHRFDCIQCIKASGSF
jgi:hypothetical protein